MLMQSETYRGYSVWGHAIPQQEEVMLPERYAASGTITQRNKVVEASGVLGLSDNRRTRNLLAWSGLGSGWKATRNGSATCLIVAPRKSLTIARTSPP
jgi:hypothetical protein